MLESSPEMLAKSLLAAYLEEQCRIIDPRLTTAHNWNHASKTISVGGEPQGAINVLSGFNQSIGLHHSEYTARFEMLLFVGNSQKTVLADELLMWSYALVTKPQSIVSRLLLGETQSSVQGLEVFKCASYGNPLYEIFPTYNQDNGGVGALSFELNVPISLQVASY